MRGVWGGGGLLPFSLRSIPVVRGLLIGMAGVFLLYFLVYPLRFVLPQLLAFQAAPGSLDWLLRPWTWFLYPLLVLDPIALLLSGYMLYVGGGVLERSWGSRNFLVLFLIFNLITALAFVPAAYLFGLSFTVAGMWLPVATLWIAWAAMDPELELHLWGAIPVKLKYIGFVDAALVYFSYGLSTGPWGPIVGLFALAGPAAAFLYVRKLPRLDLGFRPPRPRPARRHPEMAPRERIGSFNPLKRRQEQREIERLRKLLGDDDEDRPARRY